MTSRSLIIDGLVRAVTPLHVSSFDDNTFATSRGEGNHKPAMTQPVYLLDGTRSVLPYYPGNGINGKLRRRAAMLIAPRIAPLTIEALHFLTSGSASASLAGGATTDLLLAKASRENLYLGLMGGGPYLVPKGFQSRMMVPICAATLEGTGTGAVPARFESLAAAVSSPYDLITRFTMVKKDDLLQSKDPQIPGLFADYTETALQYMAKHTENTKARKASKDAQKAAAAARVAARASGAPLVAASAPVEKVAKQTLANLFSIDAIPAGTPMYFRISIDQDLSDAQKYLAAYCIAEAFNDTWGGWARAGFGVLAPELVVHQPHGPVPLLTMSDVGQWVVSDDAFGPAAKQAMFDALGKITLDEIERLYKGKSIGDVAGNDDNDDEGPKE